LRACVVRDDLVSIVVQSRFGVSIGALLSCLLFIISHDTVHYGTFIRTQQVIVYFSNTVLFRLFVPKPHDTKIAVVIISFLRSQKITRHNI
jgi:hypothetical protein